MGYIFLIILIGLGIFLWLLMEGKFNSQKTKRNAWDILWFKVIIIIIALFMIGILKDNLWKEIIYTLGGLGGGGMIIRLIIIIVKKQS